METAEQRTESTEEVGAPSSCTVNSLVGCLIPSHLVDAFDDFVTGAVCALDATGPRSDWADWEREIVEWMESDNWKPNYPNMPHPPAAYKR